MNNEDQNINETENNNADANNADENANKNNDAKADKESLESMLKNLQSLRKQLRELSKKSKIPTNNVVDADDVVDIIPNTNDNSNNSNNSNNGNNGSGTGVLPSQYSSNHPRLSVDEILKKYAIPRPSSISRYQPTESSYKTTPTTVDNKDISSSSTNYLDSYEREKTAKRFNNINNRLDSLFTKIDGMATNFNEWRKETDIKLDQQQKQTNFANPTLIAHLKKNHEDFEKQASNDFYNCKRSKIVSTMEQTNARIHEQLSNGSIFCADYIDNILNNKSNTPEDDKKYKDLLNENIQLRQKININRNLIHKIINQYMPLSSISNMDVLVNEFDKDMTIIKNHYNNNHSNANDDIVDDHKANDDMEYESKLADQEKELDQHGIKLIIKPIYGSFEEYDDEEYDEEYDEDPEDDVEEETIEVNNVNSTDNETDSKKQHSTSKKMKRSKGLKKLFEKMKNNFKLSYSMDELNYYNKELGPNSKEYVKQMEEYIKSINDEKTPLRFKILLKHVPIETKADIISKYDELQSNRQMDGGSTKFKNWVNSLLKIPFGTYNSLPITNKNSTNEISDYLTKCKSHLDTAVYGHKETKSQVIQLISQWISNPDSVGNVIGIQGPMGNGKTTLVKDGISKALGRPFDFISLGGCGDASYLDGHSFTYEGSQYGKIVQSLMGAKCMNPVFYFDELDKISKTRKGEEIENLLIHLTDLSQNSNFQDKYFSGINIDLSKAVFIFSFNHIENINPILLDRMITIKTKGYDVDDKLKIFRGYSLPKLLERIGISEDNIKISDETVKYIIEKYTKEEGVRSLNKATATILSALNVLLLSNNDDLLSYDLDLDKTKKKTKKQKANKESPVEEPPVDVLPTELILGPVVELAPVVEISEQKVFTITEAIVDAILSEKRDKEHNFMYM
jgi:ATP-dependent Lon protease